MLLTIHNLPLRTVHNDVKELILSECCLEDCIVDNLVNEGTGMRVTVGVMEEEDAAILVRKINGLYYKGQQLFVQDKRNKKESEQPYRAPMQPRGKGIGQSGQRQSFGQNTPYGQNKPYGQNQSQGPTQSFGQTQAYGQTQSQGKIPHGPMQPYGQQSSGQMQSYAQSQTQGNNQPYGQMPTFKAEDQSQGQQYLQALQQYNMMAAQPQQYSTQMQQAIMNNMAMYSGMANWFPGMDQQSVQNAYMAYGNQQQQFMAQYSQQPYYAVQQGADNAPASMKKDEGEKQDQGMGGDGRDDRRPPPGAGWSANNTQGPNNGPWRPAERSDQGFDWSERGDRQGAPGPLFNRREVGSSERSGRSSERGDRSNERMDRKRHWDESEPSDPNDQLLSHNKRKKIHDLGMTRILADTVESLRLGRQFATLGPLKNALRQVIMLRIEEFAGDRFMSPDIIFNTYRQKYTGASDFVMYHGVKKVLAEIGDGGNWDKHLMQFVKTSNESAQSRDERSSRSDDNRGPQFDDKRNSRLDDRRGSRFDDNRGSRFVDKRNSRYNDNEPQQFKKARFENNQADEPYTPPKTKPGYRPMSRIQEIRHNCTQAMLSIFSQTITNLKIVEEMKRPSPVKSTLRKILTERVTELTGDALLNSHFIVAKYRNAYSRQTDFILYTAIKQMVSERLLQGEELKNFISRFVTTSNSKSAKQQSEPGPSSYQNPSKPTNNAPKPNNGPPNPNYGPPKPNNGPPKPNYGPPKPNNGPPKPNYGPPKPNNGPPKPNYGPPNPANAPSNSQGNFVPFQQPSIHSQSAPVAFNQDKLPAQKPPKILTEAQLARKEQRSSTIKTAERLMAELADHLQIDSLLGVQRLLTNAIRRAIMLRLTNLFDDDQPRTIDELCQKYYEVYPRSKNLDFYKKIKSRIIYMGKPNQIKVDPYMIEWMNTLVVNPKPKPIQEKVPKAAKKNKIPQNVAPIVAPTVAPPTGDIPSYPQGDKKIHSQQKRQNKLEQETLPVYNLSPALDKALIDEMNQIGQIINGVIKKRPAPAGDIAVLSAVNQKGCVEHCQRFVAHHISKRLTNSGLKMCRIYGHPRAPKRQELMPFLAQHMCVSVKKSVRAPFLTASFNSYDTIDQLCSMPPINIGGNTISFKPMNITLPKPKFNTRRSNSKSFRKKYVKSLIELSKVNLLDKDWQIQDEEEKKNKAAMDDMSDDVILVESEDYTIDITEDDDSAKKCGQDNLDVSQENTEQNQEETENDQASVSNAPENVDGAEKGTVETVIVNEDTGSDNEDHGFLNEDFEVIDEVRESDNEDNDADKQNDNDKLESKNENQGQVANQEIQNENQETQDENQECQNKNQETQDENQECQNENQENQNKNQESPNEIQENLEANQESQIENQECQEFDDWDKNGEDWDKNGEDWDVVNPENNSSFGEIANIIDDIGGILDDERDNAEQIDGHVENINIADVEFDEDDLEDY